MTQAMRMMIAGTAHGIGRAVASQAASRGFLLALGDIDEAALGHQAAELAALTQVHAAPLDVTKAESARRFVQTTLERFGAIDALVCNAGGMVSLVHSGKLDRSFKPFAESDPAEWKQVIDLNLYGVLNVTHAVLPSMLARGAGRMVLVSSVSGLFGAAGLAVYSAAKAGVIAFTKALARELGPAGITVNSVAPGGIATRAFPETGANTSKRLERISVGRLGLPEEVANTVMYLAADAPAYLTGEVISVSGGPP
ncbi:MAG: SDR family oxidoreductase [Betaproteobacteria bacterium]|nr:SDR family oxidoreductase [Betaproteobacteria bacterium]MBI2959451.1 SDR family oxidoreductase [Betaproteobacteria bacterium]